MMNSWVDTLLLHDNVWLVLTFHGIDGVGWEAKPHEELKSFFTYIKKYEHKIWVSTFGEAAKYMRERMNGLAKSEKHDDKIMVSLSHTLDKDQYRVPLTLKTYVDPEWKEINVKQGDISSSGSVKSDTKGTYVLYQAIPNETPVELSKKL